MLVHSKKLDIKNIVRTGCEYGFDGKRSNLTDLLILVRIPGINKGAPQIRYINDFLLNRHHNLKK